MIGRSPWILAGAARLLFAHLTASVFIGSTFSHFKQTSFVRPVLSVIAIKRFLHSGQRLGSIEGLPFSNYLGSADRLPPVRAALLR
jgi:hypothetical protein